MAEQKKKSISISVVISLFTLIASFLTSFIFTKFLLSCEQIGDINYGLKTTADSFVSFVSIFTVGMSSTFIRFHKKYADDEESVFSAFNLITLIISLIAIAFGVILFVLALNNIILDPAKGVYTQQQVDDFAAILAISISYVSLSVVLGNSKWFLESTKNIVFVRIINLIVVILYPVLSTIFVLMGANMVIVTLTYSATYLMGFLSYFFFRIKKVKSFKFIKINKLKKSLIYETLVFSLFVVLTSSIETFNHSIDKLVLTISLNAASLTTIYQLSITLNQVMLSLTDIIYAPFLPYIAEDVVSNNQDGVQKTYDRVNLLLLLLSFLIFTGFAVCGREFVYIWVGEQKEMVYYFSVLLFAIWPLYGTVKFSNSIQRLSAKHYKSTILFIMSFAIHVAITLIFVKSIGIWSCIVGTVAGNVFLGISFIFYNEKYLHIKQSLYLKNFLTLTICSMVTISLALALSHMIKTSFTDLSTIGILLIEGFISIVLFSVSIIIAYWKKAKDLFYRIYDDSYSMNRHGKVSFLTSIKNKLSEFKEPINKFFPIVLILYFVFNFASYYLGGLNPISALIESSAFKYSSKIVSYIIFIFYGIVFLLSNDCKVRLRHICIFAFVFGVSILSTIIVPKTVSFISANEYGFAVRTTFNLGLEDLVIGSLNWLIDLIVMFFYLYIFRQAVTRKNLIVFMRFVVVFTLIECLYTFIFQYHDYLYFFAKVTGDTSFNGYVTNLSGTFASKNGFGFLLFQSVIACLYLIVYEENKIRRRVCWLFFVVFNIVNIFSLCKTSALASIVFSLLVFVSWLKQEKQKNSKIFIGILVLTVAMVGLIGLCFTPFARRIDFIDSFAKKIDEIFFLSGNATIKSRIILWGYALKLTEGPYLIFGYGKAASSYFLNVSSNFITHTFHNGILDILCSFGIFGVILYFYSIQYSYKETTLCTKPGIKKTLIFSVIIGTILYGLMENVYLLMSSSAIMLVPNVILSVSDDSGACSVKMRGETNAEISI